MSLAGMAAWSCVLLTNVLVRFTPFQRTTEPATNLLPVPVNVNPGPPWTALLGESEVRTGTGFPPVPVTTRERFPPLDVKLMLPGNVPVCVGLKRTRTSRLAPAPRLKEPPVTTLKGGEVEAFPIRVPVPLFCTVKVRSAELPTATVPKSTLPVGVTLRA